MSVRLHWAGTLADGLEVTLSSGPARHVQVLRLQPGDPLVLFDGGGREWPATVLAMGRSEVRVRLGASRVGLPELPWRVSLAVVMPANDRMDALVEKATELGVSIVQPLLSSRSVLRLSGERAERRVAHWQAVAAAASEQCGRATVPVLAPVQDLQAWLQTVRAPSGAGAPSARVLKLLLSAPAERRADAARVLTVAQWSERLASAVLECAPQRVAVQALSGPEGGWTPEEAALARDSGFDPVSLGPRVLRADTAPLAWLAWLSLQVGDNAG